MEPNQLKKFRGKINTLEGQSVLWQKEFVWQQVSNKTSIRPSTLRWRYAAALVLTGIIGCLILLYQQRIWESTAKRISFLEKQINEEKNQIGSDPNSEQEICVPEKNKQALRASSSNKTKNSILAEQQPVIIQERLSITDSLITSAPNFESVVSIVEKPQIRTIMPIIGKIPMSSLDVTRKERTVRIHLNKKEAPELPSALEERQILLAKIHQ